jgi:hypothetical protein
MPRASFAQGRKGCAGAAGTQLIEPAAAKHSKQELQ